jgi:hypothetical protein
MPVITETARNYNYHTNPITSSAIDRSIMAAIIGARENFLQDPAGQEILAYDLRHDREAYVELATFRKKDGYAPVRDAEKMPIQEAS